MAEWLKQQYDVTVLKVQLLRTRPNVRFTLQAKVNDRLTDIESWTSDTSDMGLTAAAASEDYRTVTGNLSQSMLASVAKWMRRQPGRPLWVHLVKPYGVLRFVPWERSLGALGVPVLMLPDFIFPPLRETESALEVALCGSAPLNREDRSVCEAMEAVSGRILDASPRATRLHVFGDSRLTQRLRDEFSKQGRLNVDVFVYDPEGAAPYVNPDSPSKTTDAGDLRSPWLLWMRDALRKQSIDVMHFVCHGYLRRDRGAMLFAQSPVERTDRYLAGPVGQAELGSFLTQIGAWSTAFTSVIDDNSEAGLRDLADGIAQSRPGPLLLHRMLSDAGALEIVSAYRFLYSVPPMDAPKSSALSMYCQPHRIRRSGVMNAAKRVRNARAYFDPDDVVDPHEEGGAASPIDAVFKGQPTVAPWVASTERFAEEVQLLVEQRSAEAPAPDTPESADPKAAIELELVERLRAAVARAATSEVAEPVSIYRTREST